MKVPPQGSVATHASRYEHLRASAVPRRVVASRFGLALLLQQGLAAWVERCLEIPLPTSPPHPRPFPPCTQTEDSSADVIQVLATMALSHLQEIHA